MYHCFSVSGLVTDTCGSHLVEQILTIASPELSEYIFNAYIRGRITSLAVHPVANFVLQKCISVCYTKEQVSQTNIISLEVLCFMYNNIFPISTKFNHCLHIGIYCYWRMILSELQLEVKNIPWIRNVLNFLQEFTEFHQKL